MIKNCSTKSIILAPFNSTKTHLSDYHLSIEELIDNDCIILAPRCRERDWQYQNNNNCELDNGVYNKFVPEAKPLTPGKKNNSDDEESAIMSDEEEEVRMIEKGL